MNAEIEKVHCVYLLARRIELPRPPFFSHEPSAPVERFALD